MAAAIVALAHFRPPLPYDLQLFFLWGHAAVDLFFCLSGFTLSYVYSREGFRFPSYLTARVARIYPLYFVTLIVGGVIYFLSPTINPPYPSLRAALSDFLLQALMLNSWPVIGSGVHWNFPAWSISVEWFCYILLFPLLLRIQAPRSENFKLICLVALSATSACLFVAFLDERITTVDGYIPNQWSYWVNLLRSVIGFTAGWITAASYAKRDELYVLCTKFSSALWLCFAGILVLWYFEVMHAQLLVFLFPFMTLAATDPTSLSSRLLGSRPLHFLGLISYSIYMTHALVFALFILTFPNLGTWPIYIYGLLVGTAFTISIVSYFTIEVPARNAIRGLQRMRLARVIP